MLRLQHIDAALLPRAARWFSAQWEIPARVYAASMQAALTGDAAVPRWYVALDERGAIVAGAGCIENDFHDQVACTPNLCALYVEPAWRGKGVARALMRRIQADAAAHGKRDKHGFCHPAYHVHHSLSRIGRCRNIQKYQFIGTSLIICCSNLHRITCIPQIYKINTFYYPAIVNIQAGNDSLCKHMLLQTALSTTG